MDCPPTATPQIVPAVWVPDFFWGASTPLQSFTTEAIDKYPGRLCGLLGQDQVGTERILLGHKRLRCYHAPRIKVEFANEFSHDARISTRLPADLGPRWNAVIQR
jgi:hypothetical protein